MKMKLGFKFVSLSSVVVLICCNLVSYTECSAIGFYHTTGVVGILSTIFAGNHHVSALPPSLFRKRLGSPMPQIGSPISNDDEDSDEDEEDAMDDVDENESRPRVEPHITPMNRDQCLAKLLCGMSVPVTGGSSKKNYYTEYADIVSKFFEAFPYDEEFQSKESIETYDDYSNEDDGKPTRMNSKRKPLNSTRMAATAPTLQLFDLALVDVGKPEDLAKNRTRKAAFEKVPTGNRIARARRIVENLGQKLQTVRECQSIQGCPFSFKQLREKLRKKEAQKISSNVPLPPGPVWPVSSKRKNEPSSLSFQPKPYTRPQSRPRPLPPVHKPESLELFSNEEPKFPFKDTKTGDDEMEEIFGPAPVSKKPLGFHHGVDENFNYEYDKPWRPGQNEENSYNPNPWKNHGRPRPQPKPFSRPGNEGPHRMPPRPRPGGNQPGNQKRYPPQNQNSQYPRRPPPPVVVKSRPKKPAARPTAAAPVSTTTTPRSIFPKKKISYLNSPYKTPNMNSGEDDEGSEDINKVAPVELIGNMDAGEQEPTTTKGTTTAKPEVTESPTTSSKKKDDDDESDEYDDDDYYDDDYDEDDQNDDDDDEYSDEEEDDKESGTKKKKQKEKSKDKKKKNKPKKKKVKEEEEEEEEEDEEDEKTTTSTSTTTKAPVTKKKKKVNLNKYIDDENEELDEMWTKLNFATTGANHKAPEKYKKKDQASEGESEAVQEVTATVSDEDADADDAEEDEEDEEDARKGSLLTLQTVRASSTSASDEDDDELDEENLSKPKRYKLKSKGKKSKPKKDEDEEELAADLAEPQLITREETQTSPGKPKSKKKKTKKKATKKGSSEEEDVSAATRRKQVMMEIGGRPLVPKPDLDQSNQKKTTSLIGNRFKFQFINPYGPAPPGDSNLPGAYTPLKTSFGPNPVGSSGGSSMGGSHPSAMSSLPFKFKLNPGALGNLAGSGGGHMVPIGGFPGVGSSSSASGSVEMPDPHHPPRSSVYSPPSQQNPQAHQQRHEHFSSPPSGLSGGSMGGSSLFKLNPLPALSNFFKRPSSSNFDPMNGPGPDSHGPPPAAAFVHRPIGPESSHYNRERPSPASGSSNPGGASSSSGGSSSSSGSTKKYKAKSKSRSNKGKSGKSNKNGITNTFIF